MMLFILTTGSPDVIRLQFAPRSELLYKPSPLITYSVLASCGSIAIVYTYPAVSPALQLAPASVLRNSPFPFHAYNVVVSFGSTTTACTPPPSGCESSLPQFSPPSTLFHTPPPAFEHGAEFTPA